MSVQSEIDRINGNVASTYTALSEMGATMPAQQNSDNLPGTVLTVPQGGGKTVQTDWNQTDETAPDFLKNKPFGEFAGDTVTWELSADQITEDTLVGGFFVKVSDAIVTAADLASGCVFYSDLFGEAIPFAPEDMITPTEGIIALPDALAMFVSESGVGVEIPELGISFPESGVFVVCEIYSGYVTIPGFSGFVATKKVSSKYLPDSCVEQIVFSIDENTSPTYIYKSNTFEEKITRAELLNVAFLCKRVVLFGTNATFDAISLAPDFVVYAFVDGNTGITEMRKAYPAEYTP